MRFIILILLFTNLAFAQQWTKVHKLMDDGFKSSLFPGASLYVGNEALFISQYSVGDSDEQKIYDIASLTKVVATNTSIMILKDRGDLDFSDKVSKYFPQFSKGLKENVTLEDLLRHRAGLASGTQPLASESFDNYIKRITAQELIYSPGTKTVYSDLSFILLGRVVEIISGKKLSVFSEENIFKPLKMSHTTYLVGINDLARCAPTSSRKDCKVHDPTAFKLLPESIGNAGVFTNLEDLSRFARMILNRGELDGVRIISEKTFEEMITPAGPRGLGWDFTSEYATNPRGEVFPAGISFGHTGYTGTTIWIDPKSKVFYIFLSNRVYMGDERTKKLFSAFRKSLSTAIGEQVISF